MIMPHTPEDGRYGKSHNCILSCLTLRGIQINAKIPKFRCHFCISHLRSYYNQETQEKIQSFYMLQVFCLVTSCCSKGCMTSISLVSSSQIPWIFVQMSQTPQRISNDDINSNRIPSLTNKVNGDKRIIHLTLKQTSWVQCYGPQMCVQSYALQQPGHLHKSARCDTKLVRDLLFCGSSWGVGRISQASQISVFRHQLATHGQLY